MSEKLMVSMENGQEMGFGAKQKLIKDSTVQDSITHSDGSVSMGISVQLAFRNGRVLNFDCTSPEMLMKLAAHGAEQKLGDEISGIKEVDDCVLAVEALIERLNKGEWTKARSSNGMAGTSVLLRALVEHTGKPVEDLKIWLKDKTHAQKLALRNNPAIKVIVDRLEAEKTEKSAVDTDALLSELG